MEYIMKNSHPVCKCRLPCLKDVLVLVAVLGGVLAEINYNKDHTISSGSTRLNIFAVNCDKTSNVALLYRTLSSTAAYAILVPSVSGTTYSFTSGLYNLPGSEPSNGTVLRTADRNSPSSGQIVSLIFQATRVTYYSSSAFSSPLTITAASPDFIVDSFFLINSTVNFFVLVGKNSSNYQLRYYNSNTLTNTVTLPLGSSTPYLRHARTSTQIFLAFSSSILLLSQDSSMSLLLHLPTNLTINCFDASSTRVIYSSGSNLYIHRLNNTTPALQKQQSFNNTILDLRLSSPYLYLMIDTTLRQYDLDLLTTIFTLSGVNTTSMEFELYRDQVLYLYGRWPTNYQHFQVYLLDGAYVAVGACLEGYSLAGAKCVKNASYVYTPPVVDNTTNTTTNTTTDNTTTNTTDPSNTTIDVIVINNTITPQDNPAPTPTPTTTISNYETYATVGKVLSFSSSQLIPKLYQCLMIFLDDIWYYKFHRTQYPPAVLFFTQRIDIINYFRLNPWFLQPLQVMGKLEIGSQSVPKYQSQYSQHNNNPDSFYFANDSKQIYIDNLVMNLLFFAGVKLLHGLFLLIKTQYLQANKVCRWFRNNFRWWTLITTSVEGNIMRLSFNAALQMLVFGAFGFDNKLNMLLCTFLLLVFLMYSTSFYLTVYTFYRKRSASTLLVHTSYVYQGFLFESCCFLCRCMARGLLQGLLLQSYQHQIVALATVDLLFTLLPILFYRCLLNKLLFVLVLLYNFLFFVLDLSLSIYNNNPTLFNYSSYNQFLQILIFTIIGVFLLKVLVVMVVSAYESILALRKIFLQDEEAVIREEERLEREEQARREYLETLEEHMNQRVRIRFVKRDPKKRLIPAQRVRVEDFTLTPKKICSNQRSFSSEDPISSLFSKRTQKQIGEKSPQAPRNQKVSTPKDNRAQLLRVLQSRSHSNANFLH